MFGLFEGSKCERCDEPKSYGRVCDQCLKSGYRNYREKDRGHVDFNPHASASSNFSPYDIKKNWPKNRCFICNKIYKKEATLQTLCAFHIPLHPDSTHENDCFQSWEHFIDMKFTGEPIATDCRSCGSFLII